MGPGHPERPERLRAVLDVLDGEGFARLERTDATSADDALLALVHPANYITTIKEAAPSQGRVQLDGDTAMNAGTWEAAMRAAGGARDAVAAVMSARADNAFVAMRPPGHHAETATPMGFCFFNSIAIAARVAQAEHGAERIAIMDFDVHHGNGTQEIFWSDPTVLYSSTHQMPLYPGTGSKSETGDHNTIVNAPLRPNDGSEDFARAMREGILPRIAEFQPDLLLISAGFDAHRRDPLAQINLQEEDFAWATEQLMEIAANSCDGRVVSLLEGGYDLQGLAGSAAAHVETLMGA